MNEWLALLPPSVAAQQRGWEINRRVLRAVNAGATVKEIAASLGVTRMMIYVRLKGATRAGAISPIERFLVKRDTYTPTKTTLKANAAKRCVTWLPPQTS